MGLNKLGALKIKTLALDHPALDTCLDSNLSGRQRVVTKHSTTRPHYKFQLFALYEYLVPSVCEFLCKCGRTKSGSTRQPSSIVRRVRTPSIHTDRRKRENWRDLQEVAATPQEEAVP